MNEIDNQTQDFNRRDFLKGGSVATLMTMLGGVELLAQNAPPAENKHAGAKVKVAVIGLGAWGREILNTLGTIPEADVAAICDTYPAFLRRSATLAPSAKPEADYKTILADKDVQAVIVATPSHQHKQVTLDALAAGKHVYCEAPMANSIEDAKAIALAAKKLPQLAFQVGLQLRSDPQRHFLLPFIRSGAIGHFAMLRAQWHKKESWRSTSPKPEREKELNWRLSKDTSLGLIGEIGIHALDQATWYVNGLPAAVDGFGSIAFWKDGRDVPDTVQAILEFPGEVRMIYDATLANSFDAEYEILFGSDAAVMMRENKAWLFKEVDSPLLGWEVYAAKETFGKETGIVLKAGASKSVKNENAPPPPFTETPLNSALTNFLRNSADLVAAKEDYIASYGGDDKEGMMEAMGKVARRPSAGYLEGYQATVIAVHANQAIMTGKRIEFKPDMYELA